ncbi:MAG: LysM domain-containing protein [Clostridiales bacterium]|nr:LysM domain-containing protein [Clostridiales bacterium]
MARLIKMKYKDFEFESNPAKIEVKYENNISTTELFGSDSSVQNVSRNACAVSASGYFYGSAGTELASELEAVYKDKSAGFLFLPGGGCLYAFFSAFSYEISADESAVFYKVKFTESCRHTKARHDFGFTYAQSGENAFHIAEREGVPVENIMELNDIKSAFDIEEGDRVVFK